MTGSTVPPDIVSVYLLKTDRNGERQWDTTIRENEVGWARSVQQTNDGGYVVTGIQRWFDSKGEFGLFVLKTDRAGNLLWEKTLGGPL